jgi:hypothetical protein
MKISGHIDRVDQEFIEGWLVDRDDASNKVQLEIYMGDVPLGQCVADRFRKDLADSGIGDGYCAFSFQTPSFVSVQQLKQVRFRLQDSNLFFVPPGQAEEVFSGSSGLPAGSPSRFGSLWIDRADWIDKLAEKYRRGEISRELSIAIFEFVRDGYYVLPGAVSPSLVNRLNAELESVWRKPPPGLLVETFEPDGEMRYVPPDLEFRNGRTKLLDLYAFSDVAREAISAPRVVEFLSAIFEDKPKAFQGLAFWRGSQQAIHKDTAYVKVDTNPLALAATWLALEDIAPGTGELEYFVGSHRAPDFLFGGVSKWMEGYTAEHGEFLQSLHKDAERYNQVKASFLAKAGDVLIWHADLAHGGSPISRPKLTRKSLVTHFAPAHDTPFYRRQSQYRELEADNCVFVSQYADIAD